MPEQLTPGQKLASIGAELQKAEQTNAGVPQTVGMLSIKSVNQALSEASMQKNPIQLYGEFWFEGEICCLFADSNVGKSILAVQIAADIARTQKVTLNCQRSSSSCVARDLMAVCTGSLPISTVWTWICRSQLILPSPSRML